MSDVNKKALNLLRLSRFARWSPQIPQVYTPCPINNTWGVKGRTPSSSSSSSSLLKEGSIKYASFRGLDEPKYNLPLLLNANARVQATKRLQELEISSSLPLEDPSILDKSATLASSFCNNNNNNKTLLSQQDKRGLALQRFFQTDGNICRMPLLLFRTYMKNLSQLKTTTTTTSSSSSSKILTDHLKNDAYQIKSVAGPTYAWRYHKGDLSYGRNKKTENLETKPDSERLTSNIFGVRNLKSAGVDNIYGLAGMAIVRRIKVQKKTKGSNLLEYIPNAALKPVDVIRITWSNTGTHVLEVIPVYNTNTVKLLNNHQTTDNEENNKIIEKLPPIVSENSSNMNSSSSNSNNTFEEEFLTLENNVKNYFFEEMILSDFDEEY